MAGCVECYKRYTGIFYFAIHSIGNSLRRTGQREIGKISSSILLSGYVYRVIAIRCITRRLLGYRCNDRYRAYLLLHWQDTRRMFVRA